MVRLLASIGIDGRAMTAVQRAKVYEEWTVSEEANVERQAAADIAARFGETGRAARQLRRMAALMGADWMRSIVAMIDANAHDCARTPSGKVRTQGGVFFALARSCAVAAIKRGDIARRDFFRCFYDRPKVKRVTKPAHGEKKPQARAVKPAPRKQPVVAEVYVTRRRAS